MKIIIIFILPLLLLSCNENVDPINDPTSQIKGIVIADENGENLDSVLVGFKAANIPDSLVFYQDSVAISALHNSFVTPFRYSIKGEFEFGFAFAAKPPVNYNQMFAFKRGRILWRFNPSHDTIYHLAGNVDSIKIRLKNK